MVGATLARLGCYGVLVWLLVGFFITLIFVGEYLDRPPEQQSFFKAGVTVSCVYIMTECQTIAGLFPFLLQAIAGNLRYLNV